jgi:cytochrome P450
MLSLEVQRLYPVIPVNSRVALVDTVIPLGGGPDEKSPGFIKKGTRILHFPYSMHRRKDIYGADVDEFRPERWEHLRTRYFIRMRFEK